MTSPFGRDGGRWHPGLDIGSLRSLRVTAAGPGRVVRTGEPPGYSGYGRLVEIDMGNGFTALYAHLAWAGVHVGQHVTAEKPIAVAGCTGWCTGTHLHFELRYHGRPVDPTPLFAL